MAKDKQLLQNKIWEAEYCLDFITKYQVPFTKGGWNYLLDDLKTMKIELAEQEFEERKRVRKQIQSN